MPVPVALSTGGSIPKRPINCGGKHCGKSSESGIELQQLNMTNNATVHMHPAESMAMLKASLKQNDSVKGFNFTTTHNWSSVFWTFAPLS